MHPATATDPVPHRPSTASTSTAAVVHALRAGGAGNRAATNILLWAAAAAMVWSGGIHLHLWTTGYRQIPTIGPLFLVQGITAVVLAGALAVLRRAWTALCSLGLVVGTIGGFLLSVDVGLFGFQDSWHAPDAVMALVAESAAAVLLIAGGTSCLLDARRGRAGAAAP